MPSPYQERLNVETACHAIFSRRKKLGIKIKKKGGVKDLEKMFGITRKTEDINGHKAVWLWEQYKNKGSLNALNLLLEYNKEDVLNLISLEKMFDGLKRE